jgi:hypothetical protein
MTNVDPLTFAVIQAALLGAGLLDR